MSVQKEISDHQKRYMENRKYYMEAILQDHHNNMAQIPLHRKTEQSMEEMGQMKVPQTKVCHFHWSNYVYLANFSFNKRTLQMSVS